MIQKKKKKQMSTDFQLFSNFYIILEILIGINLILQIQLLNKRIEKISFSSINYTQIYYIFQIFF